MDCGCQRWMVSPKENWSPSYKEGLQGPFLCPLPVCSFLAELLLVATHSLFPVESCADTSTPLCSLLCFICIFTALIPLGCKDFLIFFLPSSSVLGSVLNPSNAKLVCLSDECLQSHLLGRLRQKDRFSPGIKGQFG